MVLNNKVYDVLKWFAQYTLPGMAALYFAISSIWGLPYGEQIVGTLVALSVFLGAVLGISTLQYNKNQADEHRFEYVYLSDEKPPWTFDSKTYELLKWMVLMFLPAGGALYLALSRLWGFPYGEEIVGTIAAVTAFLGLVLGVSTNQFNKSVVDMTG